MYSKIIGIIEIIMDNISRHLLSICFTAIIFFGVLVKAEYSFADFPYFGTPDVYDLIAVLLSSIVCLVLYYKRDYIKDRINYKVFFILFLFISVLFIVLVPLKPFSDMDAIYKGALNFSRFDMELFYANEYWSIFPGNIRLAIFWGILIIPFPKCLVTFKIINSFFLYGIIVFTRELAKEYGVKYYDLVYLISLTFVPLLLYINHIYFDIPIILLYIMSIYLYKKYDNCILAIMVLGIARYLRVNTIIFVCAIVIVDIFKRKNTFGSVEWKKKTTNLIIALVLYTVISKGTSYIITAQFIDDKYNSYPIWNQFYIGINEDEFGFMDNDLSYDRSAEDIVNRIKEYGPAKMVNIVTKKTFWLWSQGTYQAQRYGFGSDVEDSLEKFEYDTVLTKFLLKDSQPLRQFINSIMRAQYYLLFVLMTMSFIRKENVDKYRIIYYLFTATFIVMLFYELKSRYILHLYPFMIIAAVDHIQCIENKNNLKREGIFK